MTAPCSSTSRVALSRHKTIVSRDYITTRFRAAPRARVPCRRRRRESRNNTAVKYHESAKKGQTDGFRPKNTKSEPIFLCGCGNATASGKQGTQLRMKLWLTWPGLAWPRPDAASRSAAAALSSGPHYLALLIHPSSGVVFYPAM
ncbi:hypothetical protein E2C01_080116 [Portunus trituberculatus]|uniref:Uncharacterized protein n=1 Tax=Portunus trituberculatus TaxID=210409 RepID=A0A5B7IUK6_PORTR|nr:hypothetical protein [Portunus trituberculatus]